MGVRLQMAFLDTSIIIEFIAGRTTLPEEEHVTLDLNLAELHYIILRNAGTAEATRYFIAFSRFAAGLPREMIPEAMEWRRKNSKKEFSYADALGYAYARRKNTTFITKDQAFKGMPGAVVK
jgi:predicted nucleic acid-binding protein